MGLAEYLRRVRLALRVLLADEPSRNTVRVRATARARENVRVDVFDADRLADAADEHGVTPREVAQERLIEPDETRREKNTTCIGLSEYCAANLGSKNINNNDHHFDHLAVGSDDSTAPEYTNRSLNNTLGSVDIGNRNPSGETCRCDAFIAPGDFNGSTISELGMKLSNGLLANHVTISPISKDKQTAVNVSFDVIWDTDTSDS